MKAFFLSLVVLTSVQSFAGTSDIGTGDKPENQISLICDARATTLDQDGNILDFVPGYILSKEYFVNAGENKKITTSDRYEFYIKNINGNVNIAIVDTKTDSEISPVDYKNTGALAVSVTNKKDKLSATFNCEVEK